MEQNDSTESLVRAAQNGERIAFKKLYNQFHQPVFQISYRLIGNRMRAEDVTQEVFINIYEKLEHFNFNSAFQTWCYRITVNKSYDLMRKLKRRNKYKNEFFDIYRQEELKSSDNPQPEEDVIRKELSDLIDEKLQELQGDLKTAFILREYEELSYADIAEIMNCSEGTVASRLARARSQLGEYLIKIGIDHSYFT